MLPMAVIGAVLQQPPLAVLAQQALLMCKRAGCEQVVCMPVQLCSIASMLFCCVVTGVWPGAADQRVPSPPCASTILNRHHL